MEIKLETLLNAEQALGILNNTKGLSAVVAYRISKTVKAVVKELTEWEENRKKLCEEYANKDKKGNAIIKNGAYDISVNDIIKINEELAKLKEETVNIDVRKVALEEIDKAELTPALLETIEFMLDVED